jgi:asparagine synthase (glutamine-hydrolysing)
MQYQAYVERMIDLVDPADNVILNMSYDEAAAIVASGDPQQVGQIDGQFAIVQKQGKIVRLARSIGRPLRYFLAKQADGPLLIVAERIDQLRECLEAEGYADQFHPSYTRMVPAHYLVELNLIGCPDPNPNYQRFFTPEQNQLGTDLDEIGAAYIGTLAEECDRWLDTIESRAPIGVLFSGGIDSGSLLVVLQHLLLERGESPARLKAFTLSLDDNSEDRAQSQQFVQQLDMEMLLEVVDLPAEQVDFREAIRTIEDYKPLDVQSASMALTICQEIRRRYPDWVYLVDGDGGDENMKDYPIEENPELTIRSVLNNLMLYQEGWGVDAIKHSLVYSGGQSRGHVRTYAPGRLLGFRGFSPYALTSVIGVAESIPFIELTDWDHQRLYDLKGEIVRRGVESVTGISMPIFPKRRFQHGVVGTAAEQQLFPAAEMEYRDFFHTLYE